MACYFSVGQIADHESVKCIMRAFHQFSSCSGLEASLEESHMIVAGLRG